MHVNSSTGSCGPHLRLLQQHRQHLVRVQQGCVAQALRHHLAALVLTLRALQQQLKHLHGSTGACTETSRPGAPG